MKFEAPLTIRRIAELINAEFSCDPDFMVYGINEIHGVENGDITFVDHPKYYAKALESNATTIIINNKSVLCPQGKALLFSDDPFNAYMTLVKRFRPFTKASAMISDTSHIGEGTIIQPGAFIGNNVTIGDNCIIHANASIYDHSVIGNNVIIHSNTVIGADAFYFQKRKGHTLKFESCGRVIIHDHVEIGSCCTIDKGVSADTIIGEYTKLDNHIQVGHDTVIGKRCLIASAVCLAGVSKIGDDVIMWGQVAVNKDLVIGDGCVILAQSGVTKNLEPGKVYFGSPAIEARKMWKELAALRSLPDLVSEINMKRKKGSV